MYNNLIAYFRQTTSAILISDHVKIMQMTFTNQVCHTEQIFFQQLSLTHSNTLLVI